MEMYCVVTSALVAYLLYAVWQQERARVKDLAVTEGVLDLIETIKTFQRSDLDRIHTLEDIVNEHDVILKLKAEKEAA